MALPYEDSRTNAYQGAGAVSGSTAGGGFSGPFLAGYLSGSPGADQQYAPMRRFLGSQPAFGGGINRAAPFMGTAQSIGRAASMGPSLGPQIRVPPNPGFGQFSDNPNPQAGNAGSWWGDPHLSGGSIGDILQALVRGAGAQGAFGLNPPQGIMDAIRQQSISDAGAQERAARLGLAGRTDIDPSTYGFQALMSQLGGQRNTSEALSRADLGLRQQQLAFIQNLLGPLLGYQQANLLGNLQKQGQSQGFDWGGFAGGLGKLGAAALGGG